MTTAFSGDQFDRAYPEGIERHWWHLARNRIVASAVTALAGSDATVLDIGCGRGIVVEYLRDEGIDCTGVDLAEVVPIPTTATYVRVATDAVDLPDIERQRYDTVLLLDVIEHVPDERAFLRKVAEAFPNLTCIIVTVPARQELWSNYDDFYGHHRRYTIDELESLSTKLRWDLTWASYAFHLVYLPTWLIATLRTTRTTTLEAPRGWRLWIHRLIAYVMFLDYHALPRRLPGTSLLACFRLPEAVPNSLRCCG